MEWAKCDWCNDEIIGQPVGETEQPVYCSDLCAWEADANNDQEGPESCD